MEEPEAMQEIHKIREELWEEEKGLTLEERLKKTNAVAEKVLKEQGLLALLKKSKAEIFCP